ncbi:hypothetical protein FXO38_22143 [Capsicum annuum]|nr:hypothetical protein FXO38_22143 [Capsicum annuum]KAF3679323.1 hypothetical protein FXO37_03927 [Capsicum annuum]
MIEVFELNDTEFEFSNETAVDRSGKRPVVDMHSHSDLDIQGFEDFSTVPHIEILKKAGLISDASKSQPTKRRRIVHFDVATVKEKGCEKISSTVSRRTVSTEKIQTFGSKRVHAAKTTPSSFNKFVRQDNSDEK